MWNLKNNYINPKNVKNALSQVNDSFAGYEQQDSQEFLSFFIDSLMDETNQVYIKPYEELTDYANEDVEEYASYSWEVFKRRQKSKIVDIFFGQYHTKI